MKSIRCWVKDPYPGLSHWLGAVLSVAALAVLMARADGRATHVAAFAVYGTSLILLYLASALAHSVHCTPKQDALLTDLDYSAIFLLIAGTYTPLCLVTLRGPLGWGLLAAEWALAALGILSLVVFKSRKTWPRVLTYVCMGWLAVLAGGELFRVLPAAALAWLVAGGVIYSAGAVVFVLDRPHLWPGRFHAHDLWHTMVLAASACHFVLIAGFVA